MASASTELEFVTVDVFTEERYEGNPLAVVLIPPATTLTQAQKLSVAREFNLSETTFLHESDDEDAKTWTVDIFMTTGELPFAGHPMIGTACHVLGRAAKAKGVTSGTIEAGFDIKAGKIKLRYDVEKGVTRAGIPHNVHIHRRTYAREELLKLQPRLAEASRAGKFSVKQDFPVVSIVKGMTFVLVELESEEALSLVGTTGTSFSMGGLDEEWNETFVGMYFFVRCKDAPNGTKVLRTRMIEGTVEDPATGSAASDLAAYLSLVEGKPAESLRYEIVQGVEMGRRSKIEIEVVLTEKDAVISNIFLSGTSTKVMTGRLTI